MLFAPLDLGFSVLLPLTLLSTIQVLEYPEQSRDSHLVSALRRSFSFPGGEFRKETLKYESCFPDYFPRLFKSLFWQKEKCKKAVRNRSSHFTQDKGTKSPFHYISEFETNSCRQPENSCNILRKCHILTYSFKKYHFLVQRLFRSR